jgi:hypothetical protein
MKLGLSHQGIIETGCSVPRGMFGFQKVEEEFLKKIKF